MKIRGGRKRWKHRKRERRKDQRGAETTGKFGRMLIVLGRKKKWKRQETEGTIRKVTEESEKHTVLKFRGRMGFKGHRKAVRRMKTEKR